jgi:hypothetical protein
MRGPRIAYVELKLPDNFHQTAEGGYIIAG